MSSVAHAMEILEREPLHLVGPSLTAELGELPEVVPRLWRRAFELADSEHTVFAELDEESRDGTRVVAVGRLMPAPTTDSLLVPGGRWLHHEHEGPVTSIGDSYGAMLEYLDEQGEAPGTLTLDIGYQPDGTERTHQLYLQLA